MEKSFIDIKNIFEELKNDYDQSKEHPEKYLVSLLNLNEENLNTIREYGLKLKPSQWSVLTIEPQVLNKTLIRAKELGFLEAYKQNPAFLKQDVDKVIKRIGQLEHLGIPYKNEKGKYQTYLFSERGYEYVLKSSSKEPVLSDDTPSLNDIELKEYAKRIMETFAMLDKEKEINSKLAVIEKEGLSLKESLIAAFKDYCDNLDYLSSFIDEVLKEDAEINKGRVA